MINVALSSFYNLVVFHYRAHQKGGHLQCALAPNSATGLADAQVAQRLFIVLSAVGTSVLCPIDTSYTLYLLQFRIYRFRS